VWINPADAITRNISGGDLVRVFNNLGQTLAGAVVTSLVRPGAVVLHEGSWYDPLVPGEIGTLDKHGSVNNLTSDKPDAKVADGNPSNSALVQVERFLGPVPTVTAFERPAVV
jgi:trimethylamine-N-oxide reductase (cytochrome c)